MAGIEDQDALLCADLRQQPLEIVLGQALAAQRLLVLIDGFRGQEVIASVEAPAVPGEIEDEDIARLDPRGEAIEGRLDAAARRLPVEQDDEHAGREESLSLPDQGIGEVPGVARGVLEREGRIPVLVDANGKDVQHGPLCGPLTWISARTAGERTAPFSLYPTASISFRPGARVNSWLKIPCGPPTSGRRALAGSITAPFTRYSTRPTPPPRSFTRNRSRKSRPLASGSAGPSNSSSGGKPLARTAPRSRVRRRASAPFSFASAIASSLPSR
jgi:hypothetical protein